MKPFVHVLVASALVGPAWADLTISHGYSAFGDLKYGLDFTHFSCGSKEHSPDRVGYGHVLARLYAIHAEAADVGA